MSLIKQNPKHKSVIVNRQDITIKYRTLDGKHTLLERCLEYHC